MSLEPLIRRQNVRTFRLKGPGIAPRLRALLRREDGVSAIEFGLIAPMLFFSLLAMTDVGFAIHDRMTVDHVLRSGAQPAMRDAGPSYVLGMLEATARESYTVADEGGPDTIALQAERFCICPSTGEEDATCTNTCAVEPTRFYRLSAEKTYDPIFLPTMDMLNFRPSVLVQVR